MKLYEVIHKQSNMLRAEDVTSHIRATDRWLAVFQVHVKERHPQIIQHIKRIGPFNEQLS